MIVTPSEARRAVRLIAMFGTAAAASHDCDVQLIAIRPYTCRELSAVRAVLATLARWQDADPARYRRNLDRLAAHAADVPDAPHDTQVDPSRKAE